MSDTRTTSIGSILLTAPTRQESVNFSINFQNELDKRWETKGGFARTQPGISLEKLNSNLLHIKQGGCTSASFINKIAAGLGCSPFKLVASPQNINFSPETQAFISEAKKYHISLESCTQEVPGKDLNKAVNLGRGGLTTNQIKYLLGRGMPLHTVAFFAAPEVNTIAMVDPYLATMERRMEFHLSATALDNFRRCENLLRGYARDEVIRPSTANRILLSENYSYKLLVALNQLCGGVPQSAWSSELVRTTIARVLSSRSGMITTLFMGSLITSLPVTAVVMAGDIAVPYYDQQALDTLNHGSLQRFIYRLNSHGLKLTLVLPIGTHEALMTLFEGPVTFSSIFNLPDRVIGNFFRARGYSQAIVNDWYDAYQGLATMLQQSPRERAREFVSQTAESRISSVETIMLQGQDAGAPLSQFTRELGSYMGTFGQFGARNNISAENRPMTTEMILTQGLNTLGQQYTPRPDDSLRPYLRVVGDGIFQQLLGLVSASASALTEIIATENVNPSNNDEASSAENAVQTNFSNDNLGSVLTTGNASSWDAPFQEILASYAITPTPSASSTASIFQSLREPNRVLAAPASSSSFLSSPISRLPDSTPAFSQMCTSLGVPLNTSVTAPTCDALWNANEAQQNVFRSAHATQQAACVSLLASSCSLPLGFLSTHIINASGQYAAKPVEKHRGSGGGNGSGGGGERCHNEHWSSTGIDGAFDVSCDYGGGGSNFA